MNSMTLEEAKEFQSTYLITLSKRIDELFLLIQKGEITSIDFRILTVEANRQSKEIVHIGLFVAAKDGKPLKEPTYTKSDGNFEGSFEYQKSIILYKKAQQEVIFEGWELSHKTHGNYYIRNVSLGVELEFSEDNEITIRFDDHSHAFNYMSIKSIADLAEATQPNPLKLK
jgi:hypothetical protein